MSIKIITDSGSDINRQTAAKWDVRVLPLTVRFGDEEFFDGVTITADAMYDRMVKTGESPKTSQVPPFEYEKAFREAVEAGDDVICITLSSGMSGCWQSAMLAAEQFGGRVSVIDSLNACSSQYVMVYHARAMVRQNLDREEIVRRLEESRCRLHVIALPQTLEYLVKGGRLSKAAGMAGSILGIKPIITAGAEGKVEVLGKARGTSAAYRLFSNLVGKTGGIDTRLPVCISYAGVSDKSMHNFMKQQPDLFSGLEGKLHFSQIGPTIGTHLGPDAIALGYYSN